MIKFSESDKNIEEFISIFTGPIRNGLFQDTVELIDRLKKENKKVCMLSNLRPVSYTHLQQRKVLYKKYKQELQKLIHIYKLYMKIKSNLKMKD